MYTAAHTMVGSSKQIGLIKLGVILDKMQKCVSAELPQPDFERYRKFFDLALNE